MVQLQNGSGIKGVWLSHWHEDHIMDLDLLDDVPLRVSEPDAVPLSDMEVFLDAYGMEGEQERQYWRIILTEQFHFRPRRPHQFLRPGEVIQLESVSAEVIGTPGHTPGHLSFYFKGPDLLFLGDYDLTRFGPWYGDVHSSIQDTISSVNRLRTVPAKVWVTAHETGVFEEEPGPLWDQYLDVITQRESKLMDLLKEPRTLEDIVRAWIIYGRPREPKAFYEFGERAHMKKHLEKLMAEGRVARDGDRYCRC
jgi:glyoxylase-like metal-dependent hydrolase (beta-lactamase superfamily II)